jgi:hypothetical protein
MLKLKLSHYRPLRAQEVEVEFLDSWHVKVVRLTALHTGHLYPSP